VFLNGKQTNLPKKKLNFQTNFGLEIFFLSPLKFKLDCRVKT
jgi:hypothetical protein